MFKLTPPVEGIISQALESFAARIERRLIPRGPQQLPYLYRAFLEGKQAPDGEPGLFLHKFVSDDAEAQLHNHPWQWSASFILMGSYRECRGEIIKKHDDGDIELKKIEPQTYETGDINFIRQNDFHRVDLQSDHVWTLFLHGPRVDDWSFVPEKYGEKLQPHVVTKRTFDVRDKVGRAVK